MGRLEKGRIVKERVIPAGIKLPWYMNNPFVVIFGVLLVIAFLYWR